MGLYLRGKTYWFRFRHDRRRIDRSLKTGNKRLAEHLFLKAKDEIVQGTFFDKPEKITMQEVCDRFADEVAPGYSPRSKERYQQIAKHFKNHFGNLLIDEVTPAILSRYKAKRLKTILPTTLRKELWSLSKIFSVAIDEWEICTKNPVKKVIRTLSGDNKRTRYFKPGEEQSLYLALPPWLKPIITVALQTGLRQGNILMMTIEEVEVGMDCIVIPKTKNDEPVSIPMTSTVRQIMKEAIGIRKHGKGYIFRTADGKPYTSGQVGIAFRRACERAGIEDFRFHDLRHEFATSLVRAGVDLYRISRLCGHKDQRMTQRYAHLATDDLRDAIRAIDPGTLKAKVTTK